MLTKTPSRKIFKQHVLQLQGMDNETSYFMPHIFVGEVFTVVQMCPYLLKLIALNLKKKGNWNILKYKEGKFHMV